MKRHKWAGWTALVVLALAFAAALHWRPAQVRVPDSGNHDGLSLAAPRVRPSPPVATQVEPPRSSETTPTAAFANWTASFLAAPPEARPALLAEGKLLAEQRREFLRDLIRTNPETALAAAVPMRVRASLSESIRTQLEERVSGRGDFGVLIARDFERGTSEVRREVTLNDRRYDAFVYGRRTAHGTRANVPLHGIAVDGLLAVHADPVRPLEAGEPLSAGDVNCPVSGQPAAIRGAEVAGEVGGAVQRFCGAGHLVAFNERLAADEGGGGAGDPPVAEDSWSQGPKTCLFMRVAFPDDPGEPITEDGAYAMMDTVNQWFVENSYGTASIIPTVTPLLMLPQPKAFYSAEGTSRLMADAREAARLAGFDTDNFNWDIVRHSNVPGFSWGGLAYVHGKGTWLQSSSSGVAVHELGHNYGLWHANSWAGTGDSVIGPGTHSEYGNSFDTMGAASAGANQFNAAFKNQLDWLPDAFVRVVTNSGTHRLWTYDAPSLTPGRHYALRVKKNYDRNYWLEFRQKFLSKPWFMNGVLLNWDAWNNGVTNSAGGTHLLDTTPGTVPGKDDGGVILGRTFSDWPAGVHITPVTRGSLSPQNWIDVVVKLGTFPSNRPPSLVISADRTSAGTNAPIHFLASAIDPDGDDLAYWWDFGDDTFGANSSYVSKIWTNSREFTVRCTVSDMQGGTASRQLVVTIGSPTNSFRATGRVTTDSGVPLADVRVHNGLTAAAYRGTYTGSDGEFILTGLPAGTNTISAVRYGYTLARAGWTNPISAGPNVSELDWVATPVPVVSVAAFDTAITEGSVTAGVFRITRTNGMGQPLVVKMNRTGTAALNSDFTMTPNPTNSPLQLAIPAGAASLDISVLALSDTSVEGPEFVTLTLMEDAAYALGPLTEATMTIADDDSGTKPTVTVSASSGAADNFATEGGEDTGAFTFTRNNGGVAGELLVYYAVSGTATPGLDYTPLAGVAAIPAGQSSATIAFTVMDDPWVEPNETVFVTVLTNAAYNSSGSSASVVIADDDMPTVTITATDNSAREGGGTATFLLTRQGSLAANLVVNYALSGTASNTADFNTLSGSVTILAGRATASITVTPVNDAVVEGPETLVCTLLASPACNVGNPGSASVTIVDDELPSVTLVASDAVAAEPGTNTGAFTFTRTGSLSNELVVYYGVHGTALPGSDFVALDGFIVIPAGASNADLTITPLDDAVKESVETVRVSLLADAAYSVGTAAPQLVSINDNDAGLPAVGFSSTASTNAENVTFVQINVGLSTNSASTVTVDYVVASGTATAGTDFYAATGRLSFASGTSSESIFLSVINDTNVEPAETIIVTLSNPTNAVLDAITSRVHTVLDDDESGAVTVTTSQPFAHEGGAVGAFRITRSIAASNALAVTFQLAGTASSPSDYAGIPTLATIPAGSNFVDILVTPVNDSTPETNETVVLNLISATGGRIASPDIATVTILDNDTNMLPVVTITASDAQAAEPGADTATFSISRDSGTNAPLAVTFSVGGTATSGTDFNSPGTTATIPAGAFATNLVLTVRDDAVFETNETVVVTLTVNGTYLAGNPPSATAFIADNEIGVSVAASGATDEEGLAAGEFILTRTGNTASNLAVNFLLGGTAGPSDYAWPGASAIIPAGTNAVSVPIAASDDGDAEGNEFVVLTLAAGAGYTVTSPSNATVVIHDDEASISVAAGSGTAYEGTGAPGEFRFTRTGNTNFPLTVFFTLGGSASNGVDYAAVSNSIVFPAGSNAVTLFIAPLNDPASEGDETVQLTVTSHVTYQVLPPGTAQLAIVDDEVNQLPTVAITSPAVLPVYLADPYSLLVLQATAADDGQPLSPGALSYLWSVVAGPASVAFENAMASNTTARFTISGNYALRVMVSDGQLSASADAMVFVGTGAPGNLAPRVDAGAPQTIQLGALAMLEGVVLDDGRPSATLTSWWAKVSGPGTVSFLNAADPQTTASFPTGGVFVLRLSASDGQVTTADELTVTVTQPAVVRIQAVDSTTGEFSSGGSQGSSSGILTVTRAGDLSPPLFVNLLIAGTASNGVDYFELPTQLLIQPTRNAASLYVQPIADALAEGEETVTVSIVPDPAYIIGSPASDTVFIMDTPWDDWRFRNFTLPELADPLVSGEDGDPDSDLFKNLLEYAFNRDPKTPDADAALTGAIEIISGPAGGGQSGFVVTFHRRLQPRDISYEVEVSTDLVTWQTGQAVARELLPPIDDRNGITETARVQIFGSLSEAGQRFVRLKVTRQGVFIQSP